MELVCTTKSKMTLTAVSEVYPLGTITVPEIGESGSIVIPGWEGGAVEWVTEIAPNNFIETNGDFANVVISIKVTMLIAPTTKSPNTPAAMTITGDTEYCIADDKKPLRLGNFASGEGTYGLGTPFIGTATITDTVQTTTFAE